MMGVKLVITNCVLCMTFVLLACSPPGVNGFQICSSSSFFESTKVCDDGYYCCGEYNNECCRSVIPYIPPASGSSDRIDVWTSSGHQTMEIVSAFIFLMALTCCCVCCYRCCCRRTTSRGFVYSTPGTTTAVSVSLPPQQHQQVPYPTMVPHPQQTPYPPQFNPPTNPYYGMPPPAYGVAVQSGNQQASAPSAPYIQS